MNKVNTNDKTTTCNNNTLSVKRCLTTSPPNNNNDPDGNCTAPCLWRHSGWPTQFFFFFFFSENKVADCWLPILHELDWLLRLFTLSHEICRVSTGRYLKPKQTQVHRLIQINKYCIFNALPIHIHSCCILIVPISVLITLGNHIFLDLVHEIWPN